MTGAASPTHSLAFTGFLRGVQRRCPNCDRGRLFDGYLKVAPACETCGHDLQQYRADDAGPYFTVLLIGHLVIGPLLFFPFIWKAPVALVLGGLMPLVLVLTLALLPVVKGAVIGVLWGIKASRTSAAGLDRAESSGT